MRQTKRSKDSKILPRESSLSARGMTTATYLDHVHDHKKPAGTV